MRLSATITKTINYCKKNGLLAQHNDFGVDGETMARRYLEQHDYEILETNWRSGHLEADIIAFKDHRIVFVEVKTRTKDEFGDPESFVDRKKQKAYIRLANAYILQHDRTEEARFDIISVIANKEGVTIKHLPGAYSTIG